MATVIDSLVVELGLDTSKFSQGQRESVQYLRSVEDAAGRAGRGIESQGQKTVEFFKQLKTQAMELLAVFLGGRGISEFVTHITSLDASTSRLARTMNVSTRELLNWQGVMEQTGGTGASAVQTIGGISSSIQKAMLTGQWDTGFLSVLNRIGGAFANGEVKDTTEILLELAKFTAGMDPARAAAWLSLVPGMNQDMVNAILEGPDALRRYVEAANQSNSVTSESIRLTREYQQSIALLKESSESLGRILVVALVPGLVAVFDALSRVINAIREGTFEGAEARATGGPQSKGLFYKMATALMGPRTSARPDAQGLLRFLSQDPNDWKSAMDQYAESISRIESGGDYGALGLRTRTGDRAYGKYQVMGANIGQWTREATGVTMNPEQFLNSPAAQEAVFRKKFGEFIAQYGSPENAASVWFTGKSAAEGAGRRDATGTSGADYVSRFMAGAPAAAIAGLRPGNSSTSSSSSTSVTIGSVNVNAGPNAGTKDVAREIQDQINHWVSVNSGAQ